MNASILSTPGLEALAGPDEAKWWDWPYAIVVVVAIILGVPGNIIVLFAVTTVKELRIYSHAFIFNMALFDLIISISTNTFNLFGIFHGEIFFTRRPILCESIAALCVITCSGSIWNMAMLAINRFFAVCNKPFHARMYQTRKRMLYWTALSWLIGTSVDFPNFVGWGQHAFEEKARICLYDQSYSLSYTLFFVAYGVLVPLLINIFASTAVVRKIWEKRRKAAHLRIRRSEARDYQLVVSLVTVVAIFAVMWTLYAFLVIVDQPKTMSQELYTGAMFLAHFNSSVNWIMYAATNKRFRQGYLSLFLRKSQFSHSGYSEAKSNTIKPPARMLHVSEQPQRQSSFDRSYNEHTC